MRHLWTTLLALWLGGAGAALAQSAEAPVVVELYTSQGCSSCPPADALMRELADRDDVIALALHVDYWDYIGWKDSFGSPVFTKRQKSYARAAGARTVYTPQMIVGGMDHLIGARPAELAQLILRHGRQAQPVAVHLQRQGTRVQVSAAARAPISGGTDVQVVRYAPLETVAIRSGENAGREIAYSNIVTQWTRVGAWDGAAPLSMTVDAPGAQPVVVIIQQAGFGPILGAARLR